MSYDRNFGDDRHDLGSRAVQPAEEDTGLAGRAVHALRRAFGRKSETESVGIAPAALSRITGATRDTRN
jgi:hypothetical protein